MSAFVRSLSCAFGIAPFVCFLSSALCFRPAAQGVAEFYRGKTIKLIISTAPGGEYDLWARLLVRHMGRHLPGNPGLIAVNMPGAGGITAANHLFNIAERD